MLRSTKSESGIALFATAVFIAIAMIGICVAYLIASYRFQSTARYNAVITELASRDSALKRSVADDLTKQVVASINSDLTTATISSNLASTYNPSPINTSPTAIELLGSSTGTTTTIAVTANTGSFPLQVWSPTSTHYSLVTLPTSNYTMRGGSAIGRVLQLSYKRTSTTTDNLNRSNQTVSRATVGTARIIELPSQTAVFGKAVKVNSNLTINGSVVGQTLVLDPSVAITGSATVSRRLAVGTGVSVSSKIIPPVDSAASASLAKSLETASTPIGAETISVMRGTEGGTVIELGDRTRDVNGVPALLLPSATPTNFDVYTKPIYACSVRVSGKLNAAGTSATITVQRFALNTYASRKTASTTVSSSVTVGGSAYMGITVVNKSGLKVLQVDPLAVSTATSAKEARAIYVDFVDSTGSRPTTIAAALINSSNLTTLAGFSLVTPNRLILTGTINNPPSPTAPVPLSVFASSCSYGYGTTSTVAIQGQMGQLGDATDTPRDLLTVKTTGGTQRTLSTSALSLADVSTSAGLPPVTLKTWLVLADEY